MFDIWTYKKWIVDCVMYNKPSDVYRQFAVILAIIFILELSAAVAGFILRYEVYIYMYISRYSMKNTVEKFHNLTHLLKFLT